ncbi:MAG: hypothetical protein ACXADF_07065 [Candidatus Thorarchaeota archaeon]|jgi:hypothetical protein
MLKEIFVIDSGILLFHYTKDRAASDSDQAVLSSGFMSAIRDFGKETRSEVVDSLSTENEYILFTSNVDTGIITAGVFDRKAPEHIVREALEKANDLVSSVEIPTSGQQLSPALKDELRNKLETLSAQFFGTEYLDSYVNQLLDRRTDISLAFLLDSEKKEVIAKFARPQPLFKEENVREFLLAHSTLLRALSRLGISEGYKFFIIQSREYAVASCWSGNLLSVTSGAMRTSAESVLEAAAAVCYHASSESLASLNKSPDLVTKAILKEDGILARESGQKLPSISGVFLSTLTNNLDGFFRSVTRRSFDRCTIISKSAPMQELRLSRMKDNEILIEILNH